MANKIKSKRRNKRLSRALGSCGRCTAAAALTCNVADRAGVMIAVCPACGRELRLNPGALGDRRTAVLRQFARCFSASGDPCLHAFTIKLDSRIALEDPPCHCGKPRAVLNMFSNHPTALTDGD